MHNLAPYQFDIVNQQIVDAGLHPRDFGWQRNQGSRSGYTLIATTTLVYDPDGRADGLPATFVFVRAPETYPRHMLKSVIEAEGWASPSGDASEDVDCPPGYHVWGHIGEDYLSPDQPTVAVPWPQALDTFRRWLRELAAHLGRPDPRSGAGGLGQGGVNIYGNVTALQIGPNASAVLHLSGADIGAFAHALREALAHLDRATAAGTPPTEVAIVREAVTTALTEAEKPAPNPITLRGAAMGLATTVQALGSLPQAYALLKVAAAHVGIVLP